MIVAMIPFREDKNLGRACNEALELLPEGAWAIFQDHDAMPTTPHWYRQFREAIEALPQAGAIVAMANRVARTWQRSGEDWFENDVSLHRRHGAALAWRHTLRDITETRGFGGVLYAVNKEAWRECGGYADGLGCVDHSLHHRLKATGRRIYMHEGIYAFHWRHWGEPDPTASAPKWKDCPCMRMPDVQPGMVRIQLP